MSRAIAGPTDGTADQWIDASVNRSSTLEKAVAGVAVAFVALPVVLVIATRAGSDWFPIHDVAVTDLRVRDVFTPDTPLVGPYSRFGWNHPGPLMYWLLAPTSLIAGHAPWGTLIGGAAVQLAAVLWTGWAAWRIGRATLVVAMMAILGVSYAAMGPWMLLEPWNPHLAYPWLPLLCMQAWRLSMAELRWLPGYVFVASFLVQTHVGYVPLVGTLTVVAAAGLVIDSRRNRDPIPRPGRKVTLLTGVLALVLWAPVVLEQVITRPGNLKRLSDYFVLGGNSDASVAGLGSAGGIIGGSFRTVLAPWLGPENLEYFTGSIEPPSSAWLAVPVLLLSSAWLLTRFAARRDLSRLVVLTSSLVLASIVGVARATGDLVPYLFYWRVPVALLVAATFGLAALAAIESRLTARVRRFATHIFGGVALFALAGIAVSFSHEILDHPTQIMAHESEAIELAAQADQAIGPDKTVRVEFRGSTLRGIQGGLVDHLDRTGAHVVVPEELSYQFGNSHVAGPTAVDEVWIVSEDGRLTSALATLPNAQVVARLYPIGRDKEAELATLQQDLSDQLQAAGRADLLSSLDSSLVAFALQDVPEIDQKSAGRVAELNTEVEQSGQCRCAVVAFKPADTPDAMIGP